MMEDNPNLSKDMISNLPDNIIENILCLVPIQDAGRTSILSKEWRYHWTKIPKLRIDEEIFDVLIDKDQLSVLEQTGTDRSWWIKRCKFLEAIFQVLLLHQGPIFEFTLSMNFYNNFTEINRMIHHLSLSNNLMKLKLHFPNFWGKYKLPSSFFLLHQLKDLHLYGCYIVHDQFTFGGFATLTSLYMRYTKVSTKTLIQFLSGCPLLKRITLVTYSHEIHSDCNSIIIKLFESLPMIEYLTTFHDILTDFVVDAMPQKLPTPLIHLKYIRLEKMCFVDKYGLRVLALLLRSSPNLEKIKLEMVEYVQTSPVSLEDHSDFWLEHLTELEIVHLTYFEVGLEFLKLILAKSPVLKKISIQFDYQVSKDQESEASRILSISLRASQRAEIDIVEWRDKIQRL